MAMSVCRIEFNRKNPRQFASLKVAGKLVQRPLVQLVQDIR